MFKLVEKPKTVQVTNKLAQEFVDMEGVPGDRPLSERRLQVYERMHNAGQFRPVSWAKAFCEETEVMYRINGKHTSNLFSKAKKLDGIYAVIEEFSCKTLEDAARLYATYDSKTQSRTTGDINSSFASTMPELAGVSSRIINLCVTSLSYHTWSDGYWSKSAADRAELLLDNADFCLFLWDIIGVNRTNRHLSRAGVGAAMFGSWKKSQRDAKAFWLAVRDETAPTPNTPCRKLAKYLSSCNMRNGHDGPNAKKNVRTREIYVKCIHAWNASRKNESTDLKYYPAAKVPSFV